MKERNLLRTMKSKKQQLRMSSDLPQDAAETKSLPSAYSALLECKPQQQQQQLIMPRLEARQEQQREIDMDTPVTQEVSSL